MINNNRGQLVNIFLFMIIALVVVTISAMFIYMGGVVREELHESLDDKTQPNSSANYSKQIDDNFGDVTYAYSSLYWISVFLIVGMIFAIFIGAYFSPTHPVVFVIYAVLMLIAIPVSAEISNAYEIIMEDPTLASTFDGFIGANYIMLNLPIWVTIIGFIGGVIMGLRRMGADRLG